MRLGLVIVASGAFGVSVALAALAPSYWIFAAALVAVGVSSLTMMTTANAYVQTTTEPLMRGRVMALYMAIFAGGTPIGAPIVGWAANEFGPRWAMSIGAASGIIAAIIAVIWMARAHGLRVGRTPDTRWRLQLTYDTDGGDARDLATQEIGIVATTAQRTS